MAQKPWFKTCQTFGYPTGYVDAVYLQANAAQVGRNALQADVTVCSGLRTCLRHSCSSMPVHASALVEFPCALLLWWAHDMLGSCGVIG